MVLTIEEGYWGKNTYDVEFEGKEVQVYISHAVKAPIKELIENNRMNRRVHVNITTQKLTTGITEFKCSWSYTI